MEMALLRSKAKKLIRKRLKYRRGGCYEYQEPLTIDKIENGPTVNLSAFSVLLSGTSANHRASNNGLQRPPLGKRKSYYHSHTL